MLQSDHVFSKIDLKSAYHQVPLRPEDKKFTAFQVSGKLYQFTRLPFGATNAVAAFQRIMDDFVARNKLRGVFPYMDDVIVGGATTADHDRHLNAFMTAAKKEGLTLNKSKCAFGLLSIAMLGHVISAGSKQPDPDRFQTLFEYPVPDDTKKLRRLIGFFAYYAKWIFQYSVKIHPLLQALEQRAFPLSQSIVSRIQELKKEIASASLALPVDGKGPLVLETDASAYAIGAAVSQAGRPIAFFSRTLNKSERCYSSVEKEALAIVESFRRFENLLKVYPVHVKRTKGASRLSFPTVSRKLRTRS